MKHEWLEDDSFPFENAPFLGVDEFVHFSGLLESPTFWRIPRKEFPYFWPPRKAESIKVCLA